MPSMKLTRLTNQTPPTSKADAFDSTRADAAATRNSAGSAAITDADGDALHASRVAAGNERDVVDRADHGQQRRCAVSATN